jgi:hypothetical protein
VWQVIQASWRWRLCEKVSAGELEALRSPRGGSGAGASPRPLDRPGSTSRIDCLSASVVSNGSGGWIRPPPFRTSVWQPVQSLASTLAA